MRCFYHGDVDAVAICKSCGHGVCHGCYAEVEGISACRGRCEYEVASLNDVLQRNRTIHRKTSVTYYWIGGFFLTIGLTTAIGGIMSLRSSDPNLGGTVIGGVFTLMGIVFVVLGRRFAAK